MATPRHPRRSRWSAGRMVGGALALDLAKLRTLVNHLNAMDCAAKA